MLLYHVKFDVQKMINLLGALPHLRQMLLLMNVEEDNEPVRVENSDRGIPYLEEVVMYVSEATESLLQFVIYLPKHATALKRLEFKKKFDPPFSTSWDEELKLISVV